MKKILTLNLIFAFLLSSANVAFAAPNVASSVKSNLAYQDFQQPIPTSAAPQIIVSPLVAIQKITAKSQAGVSCKISTVSNVQDQALQPASALNLNQPANCFNLSVTAAIPAVVRLTVNQTQVRNQTIVFVKTQTLEADGLVPSPFNARSIPVLPASLFVLIVATFTNRRKIIAATANLKSSLLLSFQPQPLLVLRC